MSTRVGMNRNMVVTALMLVEIAPTQMGHRSNQEMAKAVKCQTALVQFATQMVSALHHFRLRTHFRIDLWKNLALPLKIKAAQISVAHIQYQWQEVYILNHAVPLLGQM